MPATASAATTATAVVHSTPSFVIIHVPLSRHGRMRGYAHQGLDLLGGALPLLRIPVEARRLLPPQHHQLLPSHRCRRVSHTAGAQLWHRRAGRGLEPGACDEVQVDGHCLAPPHGRVACQGPRPNSSCHKSNDLLRRSELKLPSGSASTL